ncbi:MAG: methyl-accepting chemotaxis protein [Clostridia bacterium]
MFFTRSIFAKVLSLLVAIILIMTTTNAVILYFSTRKAVEESIASVAMRTAERVATNLDVKKYEEFLRNPTASEIYWETRELFNTYKEKTGAYYVYTVGVENNKAYIYIYGQPKEYDATTGVRIKEEMTPESTPAQLFDALEGKTTTTPVIDDPQYGVYVSGFAPIRNSEGKVIGLLGVDISADDINSTSQYIVSTSLPIMLGYALALALLVILVSTLLIRRMVRPLQSLSKAARQIAAGDLTVERIEPKSRDEIRELADSFNAMVTDLHNMINKVKDASVQVASSAEELSASAEQSSQTTEQIAQSTTQISHISEAQHTNVVETTDWIVHLSDSSGTIAAKSQEMNQLAQQAVGSSEEGLKAVTSVIAQMREMSETVRNTAESVKKLGDRSQEIESIVELITTIAGQTNLLALNAAIEAARAGEHGRGFAVVADEVRKLAEQSAESAQQIADLIRHIQAETDHAVHGMQAGEIQVAKGLANTEQVSSVFQSIRSSISHVNEKVGEVTDSVAKLEEGIRKVEASASHIASSAKETALASEMNAAATEQQLASMQEITASAISLAQLSEELLHVLNRFKV